MLKYSLLKYGSHEDAPVKIINGQPYAVIHYDSFYCPARADQLLSAVAAEGKPLYLQQFHSINDWRRMSPVSVERALKKLKFFLGGYHYGHPYRILFPIE